MRFSKQSFELIEQQPGLQGMYRIVEIAGRTSYKSEQNETPDSARKFFYDKIKCQHYACLEFATVYLKVPTYLMTNEFDDGYVLYTVEQLKVNPYTKVRSVYDVSDSNNGFIYITTNYRVLLENTSKWENNGNMYERAWMDMLEFMTKDNIPESYHYKRHCVKLITCRQVTHEAVRHRPCSFLQESSRYCNYSKAKFGSELNFIEPTWINDEEFNTVHDDRNIIKKMWGAFKSCITGKPDPYKMTAADIFYDVNKHIEDGYERLTKEFNVQPQKAAMLLPNGIKTEICICCFEDEWEYIFKLRTSYIHATGMPHPMMYDIMNKVCDYFVENDMVSESFKNFVNECKQKAATIKLKDNE